MSNSKNEHKEKFQVDNSSLNFSKEFTLIEDSIVPSESNYKTTQSNLQKLYSQQNKGKLAHILKTLANPPKDSTYVDPELAKDVKMTHAKTIIGTIFAHLGIGLSIFGLAALLNGLIGILILLALLGIIFSFAGLLLSIDAMKELRRYKKFSRIYFLFATISLVFSILGIIIGIGSLLLFIGLAFGGI